MNFVKEKSKCIITAGWYYKRVKGKIEAGIRLFWGWEIDSIYVLEKGWVEWLLVIGKGAASEILTPPAKCGMLQLKLVRKPRCK